MKTLEKISIAVTNWMGSPASILIHSIFFIAIFGLWFFGFGIDQIMLILTTAVSLEAIYLSLFIQMTVNRNTQSLAEVERGLDEIEEDVEDISEDIDEIQEDDKEEEKNDERMKSLLIKMNEELNTLSAGITHIQQELKELKKSGH